MLFLESLKVFALNTFHTSEKSLIATKEGTYVKIWQWSTGRIMISQNRSFSASVKLKLNLPLV